MSDLTVHVLREPDPAARAHLEARAGDGIDLGFGPDPGDTTALDVLVAGRPSAELLDACPRLSALIIPFAGVPPETRELLLARPALAAHNLHHNAAPTAEHAVALLLAAAKHLVPMDRSLREHDWRPRYAPNPSVLLEGRTALVLGYGAIGRRVARVCRALGMDVIGVRRRTDAAAADEDGVRVHPPADLPALWPCAHAVIVALPLTDETRGSIGEAELAALPERAVFVNVGRGPIVDEEALYRALTGGRVGAAGLDVWWTYPRTGEERSRTAPSSQPFHELDNVVLSPHRAGNADEEGNEIVRMDALADALLHAGRGEEMPHRVDVEAGY